MKIYGLLSYAAVGSAFVLPHQQTFEQLEIQTQDRSLRKGGQSLSTEILDGFKKHFSDLGSTVEDTSSKVGNVLDDAFALAADEASVLSHSIYETAFDAKAWVESASEYAHDAMHDDEEEPHPPHHPPHRRPPHDPHHKPHHKPNETVYELISKSKYTTKFAAIINKYPELVKTLNGTKANYTVFAPTDAAFEKIPEHHKKPSDEDILKILSYHVSPEFFPAGRVLATHTIPTLLKGERLPAHSPQRLSVRIGLKGLTLNFYSRIIAVDIFGTNGVIHGVDSLLVPPPESLKIVELVPSEFSTLELALTKTGMNTTDHPPGTLFAPSNFAFSKLGPKVNGFLFGTEMGKKYLKALIQYHIVPGHVLYSDAYYKPEEQEDAKDDKKGYFHIDLPTVLEDHSLSIDIARYYGFISIKVNSFSRVTIQDGIARDGVIQVVSDVLIPPKKLGGVMSRLPKLNFWRGESEMSVEEFMDRMASLVEADKIDL